MGKLTPEKNTFTLDLLIQNDPVTVGSCVEMWWNLCFVLFHRNTLKRTWGNFRLFIFCTVFCIFHTLPKSSQSSSNDSLPVARVSSTFCTQEVAWLLLLWISLYFRPLSPLLIFLHQQRELQPLNFKTKLLVMYSLLTLRKD